MKSYRPKRSGRGGKAAGGNPGAAVGLAGTVAVATIPAGAIAAERDEFLSQFLAGAMERNARVVGREAEVPGGRADRFALQFHAAQQFGMRRLHRRQQPGEAVADVPFRLRVGGIEQARVRGPDLIAPAAGGAAPGEIDDGVAQDLVKPGDTLFILPEIPGVREGLDEPLLEEIVGIGFAADAGDDECPKRASVVQEGGDSAVGR